jgi:hypothetical protein
MTRKQLNELLLLATQEHEKWFAEYYCGEPTPDTLIKLKQAQSNLQLVREKIKEHLKGRAA